jgi:hypothetical protein
MGKKMFELGPLWKAVELDKSDILLKIPHVSALIDKWILVKDHETIYFNNPSLSTPKGLV